MTRRKGRGQASRRPARQKVPVLVDQPSPRLQLARQLWDQGEHRLALAEFERAIVAEPNNVRAHVLAARAYAERYRFDRCQQILEQLRQKNPAHPGVHHYLGETYALLRLPAQAIASYQRASELPGASPATWTELAATLERVHRLDEAQQWIRQSLDSGWDTPLVGLVQARLQRRAGDAATAMATLQRWVARGAAEDEWTCQAWAELALLYDQLGDYPAAQSAMARCKAGQLTRATRFRATADRMHHRLLPAVDQLTGEDLALWRSARPGESEPTVALLTGFPRSGTTLLEQLLDAHHELVSAEERDFLGKELLHLLSAGPRAGQPLLELLRGLTTEQVATQRARYFAAMEWLLGEKIGARTLLDKNPAYNLTLPIMLRIFPHMRLLVALRDPRDVVVSCYLRYLPLNSVSVNFLTWEETARKYALDMQAWLTLRPILGDCWREIRYESLVVDLAAAGRQALATLGLTWSDQLLDYRSRLGADKQVSSPTYEAVTQPIYHTSVGRWRHYAAALESCQGVLQPLIQALGYD